jgi:uncharacterized protein
VFSPDKVDSLKVIDADCHIVEPYDLWTSRLGSKWGDLVPHVIHDEERHEDTWTAAVEKELYASALGPAMAGFHKFPPARPRTLDEVHPSTVDVHERLKLMDDYGIWAQVLYPNVGGFGGGSYMQLPHEELQVDCVTAYNDWLIDFASADPARFVPVCALPFWNIDAAVAELERAQTIGHRGFIFSNTPHKFGQPRLSDPHWNKLWETAERLKMPVNFHIGGGGVGDFEPGYPGLSAEINFAIASSAFYMTNANAIVEIICSGICERYPELEFVSVESGVGWVPFIMESMDWQWASANLPAIQKNWLMPSEYFKRQWYACFWFERDTVAPAVAKIGADRILYETDFPHSTSMSPGRASVAIKPRDYISQVLADFSDEDAAKILHDNAARLYGLS